MKNIISLLFLLLSLITIGFCQHPVTEKLNDVATIVFPDTPKLTKTTGGQIYLLAVPGTMYYAQIAPVPKNLADLMTNDISDTVYNGYAKGILKSCKGTILYKKKIRAHRMDGIEFQSVGVFGTSTFYSYHQVFYFNETLIDYSIWSTDSLNRDNALLISFFNSFKLNNIANLRQDNASDLGYKTGKIIGVLLILAVLATIGGLIVFLIIKKTT